MINIAGIPRRIMVAIGGNATHPEDIEGTSEEQNIYGTCTAEEHRELSEDGIDILPLPELPPEH